MTKSVTWSSLAETRQTYGSADQVGKLTVFNIKGNAYRLITYIDYAHGMVFIRGLPTHAEYDREGSKNGLWY